MRHCSICNKEVIAEEAPILAMGGFGNPKYLCAECAGLVDIMVSSKDPDEIEWAMAELSGKIAPSSAEDPLVAQTITEIFSSAGERAKKIKEGTYDFSEDEKEEEGLLEVPEELCETEEDRVLDEEDAKASKTMDKIFNWIYLAVFVAFIVGCILYFLL